MSNCYFYSIRSSGWAFQGDFAALILLEADHWPYQDHLAYRLFFTHGICRKCIQRCPTGAITETGHDKVKCLKYIRQTTVEYVKSHYGFDGYGCGLCQTGVPCESKIPIKQDVETYESL